ncbi:Uma2 family endonuclease [Magnetococcales bacterium HHB-1]
MDSAQKPSGLTEEEYLEEEERSDIKHEYIDGYVYAMVGATFKHNRLSSTLSREFGVHLKGKPCDSFQSDFKVKVGTKYFYPDIVVRCDDPEDNHELYTEKPIIIVEVLSRRTRKTDKTRKMFEYINIPTLEEYVLVEQDVVDVEVLRRSNHWIPEHFYLGDNVIFESIGLTLSVEEIYERVDNEDMREFLARKEKEKKMAKIES